MRNAIELINKYAVGKKVAAAVSGGEDSMALLHLLLQFHKSGQLGLKVVNVDHCIRKNSSEDSLFVKRFCEQNNIECLCYKADIPAMCAVSGLGTEAQAHYVRREMFCTLINNGEADLVATAHHGRDECETVLMHLFRGSGLKGLCGMPPITESGFFRPFINTPKSDVENYVRQNKIPFVVDETNADNSYDRNYIRNVILPLLRERFPHCEDRIVSAAQLLRDDCEKLYGNLDEIAFTQIEKSSLTLKLEYLSAPYVIEALRRLGKNSDVYRTTINSVLSLKGCRNGARVHLGDNVFAAREYNVVTFYVGDGLPEPYEVKFDAKTLPSFIECRNSVIKLDRATEPYFPAESGTLVFDYDKLPQNCLLRGRRRGDRFTPYGGGSKKLKEYLIDKKIPLRLRSNLIVLACGTEVYAVLGLEISDKIKVDSATVNAVGIKVIEVADEED